MAKGRIPNPLDRRHLVERDLAAVQALRIAEAYLEEGRKVEALDFLVKADAEDEIRALRSGAISGGDAFLLRQVAFLTGVPAEREEWRELALAAHSAGKELYAVEATRQTERGED
jgi:hypothetical protein